ncbi:hypothetical protein GCM10027570_24280 [Streptomonospora sediminis]
MDILAVLLLAGLVAGYLVLAGCDIGLGMLMPYIARTDAERRRAVSSMAPYFLGSEVWLVGAIGVAVGLFPALKSAVIAGMWPAFLALLAGWLFRDAGLWLRARMRGRAGRAACDAGIVGGSWVLAVSWGLIIAGLLNDGRLVSPLAAACALAAACMFALRGAAFGAERLVPAGTDVAVAAEQGPAASDGATSGAVGADRVASRGTGGPAPEPAPAPAPAPAGAAAAAGAAAVPEAPSRTNPAETADVAAQTIRPLARAALAAAVLAVGVSLLPGGAVLERPVAAAGAALVLVATLAATSGLSGPSLSRHTSALALASIPLLIAAAVSLPVAPVPDGTAVLFWSALAPAVPFIVLGQFWLYTLLRRPAPESGFFA